MHRFVVRVWLPDRPGALGQVASRIGALRGDVVGIEILEQGGGRAIDELVVALPEAELVDLLVTEISEVDGVDVEYVLALDEGEHDPHLAILDAAATFVERAADAPAAALAGLCADVVHAFEADWAVVAHLAPLVIVADAGLPPDPAWLGAFLLGSRHLDGQHGNHPTDVAWGDLRPGELTLATGRRGRPFRARERRHVEVLGRLAGAALTDARADLVVELRRPGA
jgi:hypothetical protein